MEPIDRARLRRGAIIFAATAIPLAVLVGLPFTLWVLVQIVWPDFGGRTRVGTKWLIALVVVGVAVASFILGLNQAHFLTCEDFTISGNNPPAGCTPAPPDDL